MAKQLQSDIEIQSPPARVWEVLTDFDAYKTWNPFIIQAAGQAVPGQRLEVRMQPPGRRATTFRPEVLEAEPNRRLRWLGHCWCPACSTASTASRSNHSARTGFA